MNQSIMYCLVSSSCPSMSSFKDPSNPTIFPSQSIFTNWITYIGGSHTHKIITSLHGFYDTSENDEIIRF